MGGKDCVTGNQLFSVITCVDFSRVRLEVDEEEQPEKKQRCVLEEILNAEHELADNQPEQSNGSQNGEESLVPLRRANANRN